MKAPTLRFGAKITLGFAAVLSISALSMALAYVGFERVSAGVVAYRTSVAESGLARNIDRELISYQALTRHYVLTGKEEDAKAALSAETSLKDAIDASMLASTDPARFEPISRLANEFAAFTMIFAEVVSLKNESAMLAQNQITRGGTAIRYKLDDLASLAKEADLPAVELGARQVASQYQAMTALVNTFLVNSDRMGAASAVARIKFVDNSLKAIATTDPKIVANIKEVFLLLADYQKALSRLIANSKSVEDLVGRMTDAAAAIGKGANAMKADLLSDQQRLESESDATIHATERQVALLGLGGFVIGALLSGLLGRGISKPMRSMCAAMRKLAAGDFEIVLPGLGRRDELGEMAAAVEEFKVQAIAKAERDAAAHEAQNRSAGAARRAELIRFADDFESAVGAIVAHVSDSAGQLETA
ncbi:MAG: HAMP domain-containing protein, partial [Tardiphaga sp.]